MTPLANDPGPGGGAPRFAAQGRAQRNTTTDGQAFLERIAMASSNKFEVRFSRISTRLELGAALDARELSLLYEAAFLATLCNIAFNGLGACGGEVRPEREVTRTMLEREFMVARERFLKSPGAKRMAPSQRGSVERIFLTVLVADLND